MTLFTNFIERLPQASWRRVFEHVGRLRGFVMKIFLAVSGSRSAEGAICSLVFARKVMALVRKSNLLFVSLYLKQCSVHLQQYYAGSVSDRGQFPIYVSLSRAGIPTIIPPHHRKCIRNRGARGSFIVRLYLSWFSICRIIKLAARIRKATLSSIVTGPTDIEGVKEEPYKKCF